jgi:lysozyme
MSIFERLLGGGKKDTTDYENVVLVERIKKHEGFRQYPYKCPAGKLSIGYGRNLDDCGIKESEAEMLLNNDIAQAKLELATAFPWTIGMDERRKNVLVEMVYNMGIKRFKGFKKMLVACQNGKWDMAAKEMLDSKWASQVKQRAKTLANIMKG